jgi:hypothetical protein
MTNRQLFVAESAKARRLKVELAKCKSEYANLEAVDAENEWLHAGTLLTMEAKYMSWVSSLEDELRSVVVAGRAACQAAYAQLGEPASSVEVAS